MRLKLVEIAAKYLVERGVGAEWQQDHRLMRRVASIVSQRMTAALERQAYRQGVKVNWVTRNRVEIEHRRLELATTR